MEEETLDYIDVLMEGQQIWISPLFWRPGGMPNLGSIYHMGSHLLEEETMDIIGELDQVLNE
jgi:hypothetical protein